MNPIFRFLTPILLLVVLAFGGPWLYAQVRSLPAPHDLKARANQRIVTLEVGGLHCEACVHAVKSKLTTVPGVSTVEVRLGPKRAWVVCDRSVPDSTLLSAVHAAGPGFSPEIVE